MTQRDILKMQSLAALTGQAQAGIEYWIRHARDVLAASPRQLPVPELRCDLHGRSAGQAVLSQRHGEPDQIRLNAELLMTHPRHMLDTTVPHEVAHVAIHRTCNRGRRRVRPHGREWQALMHAFGVPAETCHNLPAQPARRLQRFRYACACDQPAWLTSIRHNRARRGTRYLCRRCRQPLVWAPER